MNISRRTFLHSASSVAILAGCPVLLTGCDSSWVATAEKDVPVILQILDSILAIAGQASGNGVLVPVAQAALNTSVAIVQATLQTISQEIKTYNANPNDTTLQRITALLVTGQANLNAVLSTIPGAHSQLQSSISSGINLALTVLASIQLLIPQNNATPASARRTATAPKKIVVLTPAQIKAQYNTVLLANGFAKFAVN